jgi:methylenetetrahydrofolate dehydrogenase (NAD+)
MCDCLGFFSKDEMDSKDEIDNKVKADPKNATELPKAAQTCKVVLASAVAKGLLAEIQHHLLEMSDTRPGGPDGVTFHKPVFKLVGFLANDDPAAKVYADFCAKTCVEK